MSRKIIENSSWFFSVSSQAIDINYRFCFLSTSQSFTITVEDSIENEITQQPRKSSKINVI